MSPQKADTAASTVASVLSVTEALEEAIILAEAKIDPIPERIVRWRKALNAALAGAK